MRCAIAWRRVWPRAASPRARGSPSSPAIPTPSRRCGLRWRGSAPCWCRSISCSSRRRRPSSCGMPAREMLATDTGLAETARAAAALDTGVREFVWLPSEEKTAPVPGMIAFDELLSNAAEPPQVELSGGDLAADRLHQRHGIAAERRHAHPRRGDLAVCQLRGRRQHCRRRSRSARPAALSLRAARRVSRPGDLCRRHQRHHRQADARQSAAADRASPRHLVLRAADGVDFAVALAAVRHDRSVEPARRAITAPRSCRWR